MNTRGHCRSWTERDERADCEASPRPSSFCFWPSVVTTMSCSIETLIGEEYAASADRNADTGKHRDPVALMSAPSAGSFRLPGVASVVRDGRYGERHF